MYITLESPEFDLEEIQSFLNITIKGFEVLSVVYDDHNLDKKSSENMLMLKDNLFYRLSAVIDQYMFLIAHLNERNMVDLNKYPYHLAADAYPLIYRFQNELSSILDSIVFHLCSGFDYFGHFISYMFVANKDRTMDWDSLSNTCRGAYKGRYMFSKAVDDVDNGLRKGLERYRSGLIHKRRDYHSVSVSQVLGSEILDISYAVSKEAVKNFKKNIPGYNRENNYSMVFFASTIIRKSLADMNHILPYLRTDLLKDSQFRYNIDNPKTLMGHSYLRNKVSNQPIPVSNAMWLEYRKQFEEFKNGSLKI